MVAKQWLMTASLVCMLLPQVKTMLTRNRAALDAVTEALLQKERMSGEEVYEVLAQKLDKEDLDKRLEALEGVEFM